MTDRRLALVPPRYGPDVIGGAERVMREAAHGLAGRGWDVEVLTTCARDHLTWADHFPAGTGRDGSVTVRRYPLVHDTDGAARSAATRAMGGGQHLTLAQQEAWMNDRPRVPELFHALLDDAETYQAIVVSPYREWTSFAGGQVAPERTIVRPCLHDQPEARWEIFEPLFDGVGELWLNTEPEAELLDRHWPTHSPAHILGEGVVVPDRYDPAGFRARHHLGDRPFVLYAGGRPHAQDTELLLEGFGAAVRSSKLDLTLVTCGLGEVTAAAAVAPPIVDLGVVDDRERADALAAASACLQPSALEPFSRTVMEAWLAGTPVIANAASSVVSWHGERSGAGLTYHDDAELEQCLRFAVEAPDEAAALAAHGRAYVLDHHSWPATLDRMEARLEALGSTR